MGKRIPPTKPTNLVRESVHRNTERSRQAKIAQFELTLPIDEQVLRFQIAVQHSVRMAVRCALEKLIHERANSVGMQCTTFPTCVHVFLEILVAKFEYEHELGLGVDDVVKSQDVDVLQLLQERDLPDRGTGGAFLSIEMDFFQRDDFVCYSRATLSRVCGRFRVVEGIDGGCSQQATESVSTASRDFSVDTTTNLEDSRVSAFTELFQLCQSIWQSL